MYSGGGGGGGQNKRMLVEDDLVCLECLITTKLRRVGFKIPLHLLRTKSGVGGGGEKYPLS